MKTLQLQVRAADDFSARLRSVHDFDPHLVLCFGSPSFFRDQAFYSALRAAAPHAQLAGCSGAGEIAETQVHEGTLAVTAVRFAHARARSVCTVIAGMADSFDAGQRLAAALPATDLRHVIVFGTGVNINGSALAQGVQSRLAPSVQTSGGLAGDDGAFVRTFTLGNEGSASDQVVGIGLYGDSLSVGLSSLGGWVPFGPARRITRCNHNVLYELDGESALGVYKRYLGEYASGLPATAFLFPFEMLRDSRESSGLIRTILGVNERDGSLTLAGDVPQGGFLRLMHGTTDQLVDAAERAALQLQPWAHHHQRGALSLLVSCLGRKLVMGDRVDEEVEAVASVLGADTAVTGFYSYGELSPLYPSGECRLHNQTMTVTWLTEAA